MTAEQALVDCMKLSPKERLEVAHGLFDSVSDEEVDDEDDEIEITPELAAELERRYNDCMAHPEKLVSWEDVKARWAKEIGPVDAVR